MFDQVICDKEQKYLNKQNKMIFYHIGLLLLGVASCLADVGGDYLQYNNNKWQRKCMWMQVTYNLEPERKYVRGAVFVSVSVCSPVALTWH